MELFFTDEALDDLESICNFCCRLVKKMDEYAARNHLTRSALIVKATENFIALQGD